MAIENVEFTDWRAAEPVDHQSYFVTGLEWQVTGDRFKNFVDNRVGGLHLCATPARLAMDANSDFDFVVGEFENRFSFCRRRASGESNAHRADDRVHLVAEFYELFERASGVCGRAAGFDHKEISRHAAPSDRVGAVLHRD